MIGYAPTTFFPQYQRRISPVRLAQAAPAPAPADASAPVLSDGTVRAVLTGGLLIESALGAAGAWVGIWTGLNAKGILKYVGYGIGSISAISGIVSFAQLAIYLAKGMPVPTSGPTAPASPAPSTRQFTAS